MNHWQTLASNDPVYVAQQWKARPDARVGLTAGWDNQITVLDVDLKNGKDGVAALKALGLDLETLTPVRTRTPSGGWHLFFRFEPTMRNWVGGVGKNPELPAGLDCRTTGGLVVAPGSWKGTGRYEPVGEPLTLAGAASLPPWPKLLLPPPKPEYAPVAVGGDASDEQRDWAADYLAGLADDLAQMEEGEGRNDTLNVAAFWAGGAGAHGFLAEADARALL